MEKSQKKQTLSHGYFWFGDASASPLSQIMVAADIQ